METTISYDQTEEFKKDFKKLLKKFRSLEEDLELAKVAAIELFHIKKINNLSVFPIQGCCTDKVLVCKLKKFACKTLKGRGSKSGIRIIYAFHIQTFRVDFIEMYFKADQENENRRRINQYLRSLSSA
jgi:mRNA-degrading endonuclease RelE of RelBE toxin-antitoxin system